MLSPYRVLDLTNEQGFLCGKILAEIGADVIKVERPGGDIARNIGPFYHDIPHPEKSLHWFAHNTSKRGITLNVETADGRAIFSRLVKTADVIAESFVPGYLDTIGLGYQYCSEINHGIIMTSITPHGQNGPYRDFKAYDLQAQAMDSVMFGAGYPSGFPLRWAGTQAYNQAGLQAAIGTMIALYHRDMCGEGQHVDVSIREAMLSITTTMGPLVRWLESQEIIEGRGQRPAGRQDHQMVYPCKDGYVVWLLSTGVTGHSTNALAGWMDEEGMAEELKDIKDWREISARELSEEQVSSWQQVFARFFLTHTKKELVDGALKRGIIMNAVSSIADVMDNPQLTARNYWVELDHPELGSSITYPGTIFEASETPSKVRYRAPLIGEHNKEIYTGELGFSDEELAILKENNII